MQTILVFANCGQLGQVGDIGWWVNREWALNKFLSPEDEDLQCCNLKFSVLEQQKEHSHQTMSKLVFQKHEPYSCSKINLRPGRHIFVTFCTLKCMMVHVYIWFNFSLSVGHCPSSFIQTGHSVQFVGLSSDDLTLSVCYEKENQTVMVLYDVPTIGSSVSTNGDGFNSNKIH